MIIRIVVYFCIISILFSVLNYNINRETPKQKAPDTFKNIRHFSKKELVCLAKNMFYEARGEDPIGIALVGIVTINRLSRHHDICSVVYAPKQFSWTAQEVKELTSNELKRFLQIAILLQYDQLYIPPGFEEATHYHAVWIKDPQWTRKLQLIGVVGQHKFYKEKSTI